MGIIRAVDQPQSYFTSDDDDDDEDAAEIHSVFKNLRNGWISETRHAT